MKQLTCEMCGGTDLVKQDGVFVCQTCGTKYSVEEAKKLMIDGTVEIEGTVKIDDTNELKNLLVLARRAKESNDYHNGKKYYDQILVKQPSSWEAAFYSIYFNALSTTLGQLENSAINMANGLDTVAKLIMDLPDDQRLTAIADVKSAMINLYNTYLGGARQKATGYSSAQPILDVLDKAYNAIGMMLIKTGDTFAYIFYDQESAKAFYQMILDTPVISIQYATGMSAGCSMPIELKDLAVTKIQAIDPSYVDSRPKPTNGCYIATAVYGSYDCPEVWTLRRYRDYDLAETWYGRAFIHTYYAISPTLVKWFGHTAWFKKMWRGKLDRMVKNLQDKGYESTPYEDRNW